MQVALELPYRQGEILMQRIDRIPSHYYSKPRLLPTNVVREGEEAGHKHEIKKGRLYETEGTIYIEADKGCHMVHEGHPTIDLPKGLYEVTIQRFYNEAEDSTTVDPND